MQSSYNLIKKSGAHSGGSKPIETNYVNEKIKEQKEHIEKNIIDIDAMVKKYENLGANIIKNAKAEAEKITIASTKKAIEIERLAYEKGYEQGKQNGYEDGYKSGYDTVMQDTKEKVLEDLKLAEYVLSTAKDDYKTYMNEKKDAILKLSLDMAKIIAGKEFQLEDGILQLIEPILEDSIGEENIIIKFNPTYKEKIMEKTDYWKKAYRLKGEIFLLEDPFMEIGNAVIEKNTGKVVVGMDVALEKLEEALFK
ncbi:FliH/SctL family protein [Clostridium septicum]|uniref:Flagellar biosynthesis/type III secretory pathway-like protein n=1 Tax=Clostridium septicum TaxID=1504 RepID=A0A9N7JJH0_CLOSE|nr:flagellar biosynthesis/type III secretory pathway-like protein [Clostridium septicum]AYE33430.1 flagellar biosynthesis/type III secretory pathway-like protein [Clostridium septicum]MDU1313960.1 flagellar biosynthesis/type III secretory pathway-like protein [Clostridium septicum]QAS61604.1 flagellar biosynthesis/type III secretory pathway-like protein [Clostridium septicum]UEC21960.1 flagellar biosynthesis/type III secretory pathway-like protein [Clostridium septicum]USS00009.1 flagellar bio